MNMPITVRLATKADIKQSLSSRCTADFEPAYDRCGSLCDIHRCPLYGRFRGHSGHQPSELSARPPALAISLPVALLGGFEFFALSLLELALALLGFGDLPSVILQYAAVTRFDIRALGRFADDERVSADRGDHLEGQVRLLRRPAGEAKSKSSDNRRDSRVTSHDVTAAIQSLRGANMRSTIATAIAGQSGASV
jgi:hypothetical protein